jgi:hypothetical protein
MRSRPVSPSRSPGSHVRQERSAGPRMGAVALRGTATQFACPGNDGYRACHRSPRGPSFVALPIVAPLGPSRGLGLPGRARTGRRSPSRLRGASARLVLRPLPLVRNTTESREDEVAVTDPVEDREAAAQRLQSARQSRHLYLLQADAALAERAGYAALQLAVQRVAAREAWLTRPERRG